LSTTDTLIETSTGNSGASFAWACRALGFENYHLVIPEDMPSARIEQIRSLGATVVLSPAGEYVNGLIDTFQTYCGDMKAKASNPTTIKIPNHSRKGEISKSALSEIAEESIAKLTKPYKVRKLDYFVTALGNGLSTVSMCERFVKEYKQIKFIGFEAAQSPTIFAKHNPSISLPSTVGKTHGLLGTSPGTDPTIFPIMDKFSPSLNRIDLVDEKDWSAAGIQLADFEGKFVGQTSAAAVHIAKKIAQSENNKNILIVFYDPAWKYI
jgi:cysteine synthase